MKRLSRRQVLAKSGQGAGLAAAAALAPSLSVTAAAAPADGTLTVPARMVPVPKSVSLEAQRMLSMAASLPPAPPLPAPDDKAGWEQRIAAQNAAMVQAYGRAPAAFAGRTETRTLPGGVPLYVAMPTGERAGVAYLDIHGGGLVFGAGEFCKAGGERQATSLGARVHAVDYRMPPHHPYPTALDDCLAAFDDLLALYPPQRIVVGGGSAGGNLAAALMLRARDAGRPLPAAVVLTTPELDLTESGDSFATNLGVDTVLTRLLMPANLLYANGHDLAHPYLSPLFGDFTKGFPPTFLMVGTRDLFLSNGARMQQALRRAKVPVELFLGEAMPHGGFAGSPENAELDAEVRRFVHAAWDAKP